MPPRRSPLHDKLSVMTPLWTEVHDMPVAVRLPLETEASHVRVADASFLPRAGVKGPQAESWLGAHGITAPAAINSWTYAEHGVTVARLARSEFFIEDRFGGRLVSELNRALSPAPGVYPVQRQDAALVVAGERVHELFAQVCNVNFRPWGLDDRTVIMTLMAGVSVLVLWYSHQDGPCYRVWCDSTFGPYLFGTLLAIAGELGGGMSGLGWLYPELTAETSLSAAHTLDSLGRSA